MVGTRGRTIPAIPAAVADNPIKSQTQFRNIRVTLNLGRKGLDRRMWYKTLVELSQKRALTPA